MLLFDMVRYTREKIQRLPGPIIHDESASTGKKRRKSIIKKKKKTARKSRCGKGHFSQLQMFVYASHNCFVCQATMTLLIYSSFINTKQRQ